MTPATPVVLRNGRDGGEGRRGEERRGEGRRGEGEGRGRERRGGWDGMGWDGGGEGRGGEERGHKEIEALDADADFVEVEVMTHSVKRRVAQGCSMSSLLFPVAVHRTVSTVENQMRNSDPNGRGNTHTRTTSPSTEAPIPSQMNLPFRRENSRPMDLNATKRNQQSGPTPTDSGLRCENWKDENGRPVVSYRNSICDDKPPPPYHCKLRDHCTLLTG